MVFPSARAAIEAALEAGLLSTRLQCGSASTFTQSRGSPTTATSGSTSSSRPGSAPSHGSQIVVSQATRDLIDKEVRDLGDHRLKDIPEPLRLYQLGEEEFPPLRSLNWTNLPLPRPR